MAQRDSVLLEWSGELTFTRAEELKASLLEALRSAERVDVDLARVTSADACSLQLLCAAHREAVAERKTLALTGRPQPGLTGCAEAGGFLRTEGCVPGCLWSALRSDTTVNEAGNG